MNPLLSSKSIFIQVYCSIALHISNTNGMTGQGEGDTAKMLKTYCNTKIVSEYDQEIQQSQTADKPVAS